jgi:DNA-binding winged helix-turn-helix (wHTH) protein
MIGRQVVEKDEFFRSVWAETVVSDDALAACIQELRRALRDAARKPRYIETVHRRGYRFLPPVTTQPVPSVKVQVPSAGSRSQNPEVSSQEEIVSSHQEERQKAKDRDTREAEGLRLQASGLPPFSPSSLQPAAYNLS